MIFEILATLVSIIFCALVAKAGVNMVIGAYEIGSTSTSLKIPLYFPYASVPIGLALMTIRYLLQLKNTIAEAVQLFAKGGTNK